VFIPPFYFRTDFYSVCALSRPALLYTPPSFARAPKCFGSAAATPFCDPVAPLAFLVLLLQAFLVRGLVLFPISSYVRFFLPPPPITRARRLIGYLPSVSDSQKGAFYASSYPSVTPPAFHSAATPPCPQVAHPFYTQTLFDSVTPSPSCEWADALVEQLSSTGLLFSGSRCS